MSPSKNDQENMKPEEFLEAIRSKYIKDPFGVSGFAFWKIEEQIATADTLDVIDTNTGIVFIAVAKQKLVFYWSAEDIEFVIPFEQAQEFRLLSLHSRYEALIQDLSETHQVNAYTPLGYDFNTNWNGLENDNIRLVTIDTTDMAQLTEIAEIISESIGGNLSLQTVAAWTENRVFSLDLWIGAIDQHTSKLVGIGISTYNSVVAEVDLDWFYIKSEYKGQGIGKQLVGETIARSQDKAHIIRVAGQANEFYQKCGFVVQDKWYYLPKKEIQVAWWE